MSFKNVIFFVFLFAFVSVGLAQDKLLLTNGHIERGQLLSDSNGIFQFKVTRNNGKFKTIPFDEYRVFSLTNSKGLETVVYKQDSSIGNMFSQNEMRMFVYGQRDANAHIKSSQHFMLSYFGGLSFSLFDTYSFQGYDYYCAGSNLPVHVGPGFFHSEPTVSQVLIPFAFAVVSTFFKSKIRKEHVSDVAYLANEQYVEGFKKVKKFKKMKNIFLGSVAGVATGLIGFYASGGVPVNCQ